MAVSGTFAFNPQLIDQIDEAFERCGIDPADLQSRHIRSAIRSANLTLSDWQNFGYNEYALVKDSQSLSVGDNDFTLPAGGYDIFHATLKNSDGTEREIYPISRTDYNALHNKTQQGEPDRYFVDRSTFTGANPASTVFLFRTPDDATDTIEFYYIRKQYDAGDPQSNLDMSPEFYEAFAAGLAFHLSIKFEPDRTDRLGHLYLGQYYKNPDRSEPGGALGRALTANRETADAVFRVRFDRHRGRR